MGVPMGISVRHNSKLAAAVALAAAVLAVVWFARALQTGRSSTGPGAWSSPRSVCCSCWWCATAARR